MPVCLHIIGEVNNLVCNTLNVSYQIVFILLECERIRSSVHYYDRGKLSIVLERACMVHKVIDNLSVCERLIC